MFRLRLLLTTLTFASLSSVAIAATAPTIVTPDTAQWQPGTGAFAGTQIATIVGNRDTPGAYYAYLLKMSDGTRVPPHFHGMTENVTVISGTLMVGIGDSMNVATMSALPAGGIASIPAGVHHYAMAKGTTVIEVSGIGPDTLTLVQK